MERRGARLQPGAAAPWIFMDLLLFSGFLGSGKTTLILALARELAAQGRRTAFVVNEVGEVGVDQAVLARRRPHGL